MILRTIVIVSVACGSTPPAPVSPTIPPANPVVAAAPASGCTIDRKEVVHSEVCEQACDRGDGIACYVLAAKYWAGDGVPRSGSSCLAWMPRMATTSASSSSSTRPAISVARACESAALSVLGEPAKALAYNEKACEYRSYAGCSRAATMHEAAKADPALINRLRTRACSLGDESSCRWLQRRP